jgi:hypothetical protein
MRMRRSLIAAFFTAIALVAFGGTTKVREGERVTLLRPLEDGVTYIVETPHGKERWRDRDLYHLALYGETCTVVRSLGSEVQLHVPLMNQTYWFVVE